MKKQLTKIMMGAAVCLLFTAASTKTTQAQNGRFSIGAELALPMGDFGDGAGIGFGGSVGYEHPIGDMMGLGLRAGYLSFSGKDGGPSSSMIPAQAFFKYYFGEQQNGFYAMANLGIHNFKVKIPEYTYTDPFTGQTITLGGGSASSTDLSYAPEIGYHLANLDLGLRYQIISSDGGSTSYLGARIAYVFGEK